MRCAAGFSLRPCFVLLASIIYLPIKSLTVLVMVEAIWWKIQLNDSKTESTNILPKTLDPITNSVSSQAGNLGLIFYQTLKFAAQITIFFSLIVKIS